MPILTPDEHLGLRVADRYRLDAILCTGGMGVLFEALDHATGQHVAVKMLKPAYALEPARVARFLRETRIAFELRHPNIATVLDVGTADGGIPYLVMDLLRGHSLATELETRGTLPMGEALAIVLPIANALVAAHGMGIVHRDIKPGNIFLCRDDGGDPKEAPAATVPKLLDFGIAKSARDDFETDTGIVVGTPGYMAPEQLQHGGCGPSTDIWGVGAVLYRCLMGRPPHVGNSVPEVLQKLLMEPVQPVSSPGVGKGLCATIDRALARDPHRRYPSMAAFARELSLVAARADHEPTTDVVPAFDPSTPGSDPSWVARPRRQGRSGAVGFMGLGFLAASVLLFANGHDTTQQSDVSPYPRAGAGERSPQPGSLPTLPPSGASTLDSSSWRTRESTAPRTRKPAALEAAMPEVSLSVEPSPAADTVKGPGRASRTAPPSATSSPGAMISVRPQPASR